MNEDYEKDVFSEKQAKVKGDDMKEDDMSEKNGEKQDTSPKPKGGYVTDKSRILTRVLTPDLEYPELRAIYEGAFVWYEAVKSVIETSENIGWIACMPMGLIVTDYIVFRFWRYKHEVWGEKGKEIYCDYRAAFEVEEQRLVRYLEDKPFLTDLVFYAWFATHGYMRCPPQPRAKLLKRAREWRDTWEGN